MTALSNQPLAYARMRAGDACSSSGSGPCSPRIRRAPSVPSARPETALTDLDSERQLTSPSLLPGAVGDDRRLTLTRTVRRPTARHQIPQDPWVLNSGGEQLVAFIC